MRYKRLFEAELNYSVLHLIYYLHYLHLVYYIQRLFPRKLSSCLLLVCDAETCCGRNFPVMRFRLTDTRWRWLQVSFASLVSPGANFCLIHSAVERKICLGCAECSSSIPVIGYWWSVSYDVLWSGQY